VTFEIPEIADERLAELAARIKPLVLRDESKIDGQPGRALWSIKPCDLRGVAFPWDPQWDMPAPADLVPLRVVRTLHTYGYYGMFKPSVAEVLAQIPADLVETAVAFSVDGPKTATDLGKHPDELNAGFHVAQTTFYGRKT
jgi:hypothetical protein